MGGAAGLFVGASLLSFVELFYYFSLRLCRPDDEDEAEQQDKGDKSNQLHQQELDVGKLSAVAPVLVGRTSATGHYHNNLINAPPPPAPPPQDPHYYSRF